MNVIIRPLEVDDALISYKWRNNSEIWKYTGTRPDKEITYEMELNWIREVLSRKNEKRFAICINDNREYVGNVQLTDISSSSAQLHIFIGDINYHGLGIGYEATKLVVEYGFSVLELNDIFLYVNQNNESAIAVYLKVGFVILQENHPEFIKMIIRK